MNAHAFVRLLALLLSVCVLPAQAQQGGLLDSIGSLFKPREDATSAGTTSDEGAATRALKPAAATGGEKRVALVIGNNAYQTVSKLEKAGNDARAVGRALEKAGFQIRSVIDGNRTQMNMAINQFVDDVAGGGIGVFFFAGHGVQVNNQNFLIPIDLPAVAREADIADHGISLQNLQDKIADARAKFSLLVIDACRDNPLPKKAGRSIGATRGLTQASSAEGQMVVFSAGANQQALDKLSDNDANPNGVFTREFLPWVTKPGVTIRDAVLSVRSAVRAKAKTVDHDQFPAIYDQAEGNFYFIFQGPATVNVQSAPADPEAEAWGAAERANTEAAYRSYLDAYPKGRFVPAAKIALEAVRAPAKPVETAKPAQAAVPPAPTFSAPVDDPESALWTEVKQSGAREYYEAYLKQYPKGKYAALARIELGKIADREKADRTKEDAERKLAAERDRQAQIKADQDAWDAAKSANSATVQGYLDRYPNGRYVSDARTKLAGVKKEEAEMKLGKVFEDCPDCPDMVVIPGGIAIGRTEVTQGQWRALMGNNPSHFASCGDTCPVEQVSWDDVQEYVRKLTQKTGKTYRLPTEVEWERACRAGSQQEYCGSDNIDSVAWYDGNSGNKTRSVAGKQPNAW